MSLSGQSERRQAEKRARFLARATDLREREAIAVAFSERGYSHAGIAEQIDSSRSTVSMYLDRAVAQYGPQVDVAHRNDTTDTLTEVTTEEIVDWPDYVRERWFSAARDHPDRCPDGVEPAGGESSD